MMKSRHPSSLQWRLTLGLLSATGLIWVVVLAITWSNTEHELNELLDAHLAQTAAVLVAQTGEGHAQDFTTAQVLFKYQPRVAFQIWHEDDLVSRSFEAPTTPLAPLGKSGISDQVLAQKSWRVFATPGLESDVWVVVAELQSARDDILQAGLESAIVPMLLAFPALGLLIWAVIFQSLSPLRQLSQSVSGRHPDAREPLSEDLSVEVLPLVRSLNHLFEKMALQMESERRFTADAAHELRTPIAAIRMQAQVARGSSELFERQTALDAVLQGCDRASRLVTQLLQLARLDADVVASTEVSCDAVAETRSTLADLGPQLLSKGQNLSLDAPDQLRIAMPIGLVGVLVGNLVDNAMRYSPHGAVVQVQWLASPRPQLIVQDSGPGLSAPHLSRLGDRFFRVPDNGADGSGLGWSIVRRLAQRYALEVQVMKSADLGGLQVVLTWPVA